jgi:hypothetical protein
MNSLGRKAQRVAGAQPMRGGSGGCPPRFLTQQIAEQRDSDAQRSAGGIIALVY